MEDETSSPALSDNEDYIEDLDEELGVKIDTSVAQQKFSKIDKDDGSLCSICEQHVYQMEKVKAEKRLYHKTCFRCKECNKQLNVDSYNSHEGQLYCQIHFKHLFQPKAKFDEEDLAPTAEEVTCYPLTLDPTDEGRQKKNEMIIRENIPQELPPDVVRYDTKLDDGLDNYQLDLTNIRQRFESGSEDKTTTQFSLSDSNALQRSESLLVRLQRYQSAVTGERNMSENGHDSSPESSDEEGGQTDVIRETKKKEKVAFAGLSSLKSQWESGSVSVPGEEFSRDDDKKEQLYRLRQRICLGRSASMRQVYENACTEKTVSSRSNSVVIESRIKAVSLKEKFERGEVENETEEEERLIKLKKEKEEDLSVVTEAETAAREAKNIFKQMDATNNKGSPVSPVPAAQINGFGKSHSLDRKTNSTMSGEVIKCSDPSEKEEVMVETTQVQERFKFFECFKQAEAEPRRFEMTPPPEKQPEDEEDKDEQILLNQSDQEIVRSAEFREEVPKTDTAKKMLSKFKQLESQQNSKIESSGPKPLKRITPPREYTLEDGEEKEPTPERDPNIVRSSYKSDDVIPVEPEKARSLKEKFENWSVDVDRENKRNFNLNDDEFTPRLDITKNLRAKFEAIKDENGKTIEKPKPRVNRFVNELGGVPISDVCNICGTRLYPMEKLEFSGMKMHKNCFKCSHCMSSLRLDNYTLAAQKLYCIAHFKQLFMSKGNYDEGFGREQHKEKWFNRNSSSANNNNNNNNNNNADESNNNRNLSSSMEDLDTIRDANENEFILGKVEV